MNGKDFLINRIAVVLALIVFASSPAAADPGPGHAPPTLPPGIKMAPNIEYANVQGHSLLLDLYLPENALTAMPVIVFIHGGGWEGGTRDNPIAIPFVLKGYVVASIDYRLSQVAKFPAQIQDCKAAIRWLRAHARTYNMDPRHLGVWGDSAGGHLVALLGTSGDVKDLEGDEGNLDQSSRVQAVCDWFGPTDFLAIENQAKKGPVKQAIQHNSPDSPEAHLLGGPIQENKKKARAANPITYVSKDDPPFLIMHGDRDPLVPLGQSELLRDALKARDIPVELVVVHGAGHGFRSPQLLLQVQAFFDTYLKTNPASVPATLGATH